MLNKIKVIGMFLKKEQPENKIDDVNSVPQETENEVDKSSSKLKTEEGKENNRESWLSFGLMNQTPSGSNTPLWCVAQGEVAKRIQKEVGQKEVIEVWGYLRNQMVGRQIIIKVVKFNKLDLDLDFEKIDIKNSNQVRLLGKIINDLQPLEYKNKWNQEKQEKLTFKLSVPREGIKLPLFFCRVNEKELILEINEKLKKGDIILLEGFLQTQRPEKEKPEWVSAVVCYGFTLLDDDSVNIFNPLGNLTRVVKEVRVIEDFIKPKIEV